jgi:tetratricopeptide (TPR) repeat protein
LWNNRGVTWLVSTASGALALLALLATPGAAPQADRAQAYYRFLLGRHLEAQGDIDRAAAEFREAARLDPAAAEIRAELAAFYARQDQPIEAAEWGEAALALDPSNPEAHRVLGFVQANAVGLESSGRLTDVAALASAVHAIEHLEAARRRDRFADVSVELTLARLYLRTGTPDRAVPVLLRVLALDPDRPVVVLMLAEAYEAAGQLEQAAAGFLRAAEQRPRDPDLQERLGDVLFRLGRYGEAVVAWQRALSESVQPAEREGIERKIRDAREREGRR